MTPGQSTKTLSTTQLKHGRGALAWKRAAEELGKKLCHIRAVRQGLSRGTGSVLSLRESPSTEVSPTASFLLSNLKWQDAVGVGEGKKVNKTEEDFEISGCSHYSFSFKTQEKTVNVSSSLQRNKSEITTKHFPCRPHGFPR